MLNLANLDESTPYLGQLKEVTGPVTIIKPPAAPLTSLRVLRWKVDRIP